MSEIRIGDTVRIRSVCMSEELRRVYDGLYGVVVDIFDPGNNPRLRHVAVRFRTPMHADRFYFVPQQLERGHIEWIPEVNPELENPIGH